MRKNLLSTAFLLQVVLTSTAFGADGTTALKEDQSVQIEESAEYRINFSGKLRMLSQRIPSAACHLGRGVDPEGSRALLAGATAEFEKILSALEFGDADLNIVNPETRRLTLAQIHTLRAKWEPFNAAAQAVLAGSSTDADIDVLMSENINVLKEAQRLVEELMSQYSNPNAVSRASLMLVDISGRQRMLTQKMSKESCIIEGSSGDAQMQDNLEGTMQIFEASLDALRLGMPTVGVRPPPNDEIYAGLEGVREDWQAVKPLLSVSLEGQELDGASDIVRFQGLNTTMANMNKVVGLYAVAATAAE